MKFFEKTCCFAGHRDIPKEDIPQISRLLNETIKGVIEEGFRFFGTGGALGFDTLASEAVLGLRQEFPSIRLILVLPCRNQTRGWKQENIIRYNHIRAKANKVVILCSGMYAKAKPPIRLNMPVNTVAGLLRYKICRL